MGKWKKRTGVVERVENGYLYIELGMEVWKDE